MAKAVHFHGVENIVEAFENKGIPFFAVVSDKCIIHKNATNADMTEAGAELQQFLEMLNNASNAVYTLKIFETVPTGGIKENTPADYSLNFRLNLPDMLPEHAGRQKYYEARSSQSNEILSEIKALNKRIDDMEKEDEDDEPQGISGIFNSTVNTLIQNPEVQQMIAGKLIGFLGNLTGGQPAAIAGVPGTQETIADDVQEKIDTAIQTIADNTPGGAVSLCQKLEKLAAMSVSNPGQFQMLLKML
jgi:hypothetical protein